MSLDMTSFDAALKQHYTSDAIENLVYKDNPFFALVAKYEEFGGRNLPIPLIYGNPQGRSATFSNAQTRGGTTNSQITDFIITRVKDYSIATIDNETLEASKGNANAFMEAATTEIDGAINSLTRSLAVGMYRGADGSIGQVNAEPSEAASTVITMKSAGDITNIEINMALNIWSAKSGGTQRNLDGSTTQMVVSAVDRSAGTFTISTAYDSSGTIAADDFVFVEGDRGLKMSGLDEWLPTTAPSSGDSHFGVDRSVDTNRLAGIRYDGSSDPIEEALIEGASRVAREGGKVDHCFLSYAKYAELEKALGSKVQYVELTKSAEVGFRGILVNGPRGAIKVIPDQNCPDDKAYMLQLGTWKFYSLGKAVRVIDTDGLNMLRQASADGVEVRWGSYHQLGCKGPGFNAVITL
jgi:hypothetical protein